MVQTSTGSPVMGGMNHLSELEAWVVPALNLTGAKTENGQGKAGTGHRSCSALAAGGLGAAQSPPEDQGVSTL